MYDSVKDSCDGSGLSTSESSKGSRPFHFTKFTNKQTNNRALERPVKSKGSHPFTQRRNSDEILFLFTPLCNRSSLSSCNCRCPCHSRRRRRRHRFIVIVIVVVVVVTVKLSIRFELDSSTYGAAATIQFTVT